MSWWNPATWRGNYKPVAGFEAPPLRYSVAEVAQGHAAAIGAAADVEEDAKAEEMVMATAAVVPAVKQGFFSRFESAFKRLFGNAPAWEHYASVAVTFAAPFVESLVGLYGGPVADAEVTAVFNRVKSGLATLSAVTGDGSSPVTVAGVLSNLQANLQDVLKLGAIKDPAKQTEITQTVNLVIGEFAAVQAMLPAPAAAAATK